MDMIILLIGLTAKYTQNLPHSDHLQQSTWSQPLFLPDRDISLLPKPVSLPRPLQNSEKTGMMSLLTWSPPPPS